MSRSLSLITVALCLLAAGLTSPLRGQAQFSPTRLVEWVENNPTGALDRIALGYPAPIPVDTPLPFDGFRTYAGLRARHMDLAASTPWVHGDIVGQTRAGREIWAYRLGDEDRTTRWGLPEPATLTNGGIHAREWQSPEVVTGVLERLATGPSDQHLLDYLRNEVNMVVIPVHNVDGFLQTQRTPTLNYLGADPTFPDFWPRDGRMRRKNMLGVDENLFSVDDHLGGVDLNRNNPPYWDTTNGGSSSDDVRSLIHHGAQPQSEPEARALDAAAVLGPVSQLRLYTDVHSFSMVHFWTRTDNERLAVQTEQVLDTFTDHHLAFPAGKFYAFADRNSIARNQGIGTTDEYFTAVYQVPSWTLEVEPSNGQDFHAPLPGGGADYGGFGVNGHDGFILPESQIRRVREQLAETFTTVYYRQAGPPHIQSVRIFDAQTGALVASQDWDPVNAQQRERHFEQLQPLELARDYVLWLGFSKPMRWLDGGEVARFPGADSTTVTTTIQALAGTRALELSIDEETTALLDPAPAPEGYRFYRTDAFRTTFRLRSTSNNREALSEDGTFSLRLFTRDMTGLAIDADPATVAGWADGHWVRYEDSNGNPGDRGGTDESLTLTASLTTQPAPFTLEPGIAAAWFDPNRNGEGFIIEILPGAQAVLYWFTYNENGEQDWLIAQGTLSGNQLRFPELLRVSGGVFGPGFDPDAVTREIVGDATFSWSSCSTGFMDWHIGNERGRQALDRLTNIQGLDCGPPLGRPIRQEAQYSGAWFDPTRSGEGYTLQILEDNSALVYWFSFDPAGERRWFFGAGTLVDGTWVFPEMNTTRGPVFGEEFDPDALELQNWGRLEMDLSCDGGEARYESTESGFGSGVLSLVQLTNMDGPACP
ncbi:MAG: M14 family zinc carboxypeptidase [Pseudomonadota bacterium]